MSAETVVFKVGNSLAVRLVGDCKLPRGTRIRERLEGDCIVLEPVVDG
jgi:virulence-associated protein VagC